MSARAAPGTARQMVLDLTRAPSFDPDDFLVSPANAEAHALVMAWPEWPSRTLLLVGPPGAGKSHLATIWAGLAGARPFDPEEFPRGAGAWLVEDADRCRDPEAALFHLLNLVEEARGWLIVTAQSPPDRWGLCTPDLLSRLRRAPVATIGAPDAELLRSVLVKLFADRQIRIDADVVAYAALHCEQSLEAILRFVAAVDEAALAEGRRITRPLAARALASLTTSDRLAPGTESPRSHTTGSIDAD